MIVRVLIEVHILRHRRHHLLNQSSVMIVGRQILEDVINANVFPLTAAKQDAVEMLSNDQQVNSLIAARRPQLVVLLHIAKFVQTIKERRNITNYIEKRRHITLH